MKRLLKPVLSLIALFPLLAAATDIHHLDAHLTNSTDHEVLFQTSWTGSRAGSPYTYTYRKILSPHSKDDYSLEINALIDYIDIIYWPTHPKCTMPKRDECFHYYNSSVWVEATDAGCRITTQCWNHE